MVENAEKVVEVAGEHFGVRTGVEKPVKMPEVNKPIELPDSPFEGFRCGANLDLRVRLAMDMLTHSPMFAPGKDSAGTPEEAALFALDAATYLFDTAHERGLIKPFGKVADDPHLMAHIDRQIEFQITSQKRSVTATEDANRIKTAVRGAFNQ